MSDLKAALKQLGLTAVYGIDLETYYDNDYSLRKMATTEYICDPRFESQLVAVQKDSWKTPKVMTSKEFKSFAATVNWSKTGMLAHHTAFDGLIASHHFGIKPAFYFDTLSMARPIMPISVGGSLDKLARAFGFKGKVLAQALVDVKGKHFKEFSKSELKLLKDYAGDDIEQTWGIFLKMLPYTPLDELKLIDLTIKMYAQPTLRLDKPLLLRLERETIEAKERLLLDLGADRKQLMSNEKFAALLRFEGVEPPTKVSKATGKPTYAFSKQDIEFKALLEHDDIRVSTLVAARLGTKSTITETRAARMAQRADYGPMSVYLNFWGAKTGRWSGGDRINFQNMGRGSDLRTAISAPDGHTLIIADLAQIEARVNAWFSGQQNIVDAFANNDDVYSLAASLVYNRKIDKKTDPTERFVGKVMVLALGYGAGWQRFAEMLRIGAFGPPIDITDNLARDIHTAWRRANPHIVAGWKRANNLAQSAFIGQQRIDDKIITYEGLEGRGLTWLPGGVHIRYDGLSADHEGMNYVSKSRRLQSGEVKEERQRLYGGLIVENNCQALARQVIGGHMLEINDALSYWRQAMTTHDEIVGVVPTRYAQKALRTVQTIMSRPPSWAPGLPIAVDAHISKTYDK